MDQQRLEFVISAINRAKQAITEVAQNFGSLEKAVTSFNNASRTTGDRARQAFSRMADGFRAAVNAIRSLAQQAAARLAAMGLSFEGAARLASAAMNRLRDALLGVLGVARTVAMVLGGGLFAGLFGIAGAGVSMNEALSGAEIALTKMLGSAKGAAGFIAELRKEAVTSSLTFKEMLPIAQSLVAIYGPQGLGRVIPTMRAFADTATALQLPQEAVQQALFGFRQLLSSPTPQKEELNQINEALPGANILSLVRDRFGAVDGDDLAKVGATGQSVGAAIIEGLQKSFGGSQAKLSGSLGMIGSGILDTGTDIAASVTQGLTGSLRRAGALLKEFLELISRNERILGFLRMIFDAVGRALEMAAGQLEKFVGWLEKLADGKGVSLFLTNVIALVQTLFARIAELLGLDFGTLFDPEKFKQFFDQLGRRIADGINLIFGLARVFQELKIIVGGVFTDLANVVGDVWQDISLGFRSALLEMKVGLVRFVADAIDRFANLSEAIEMSPWVRAAITSTTRIDPKLLTGGVDSAGLRSMASGLRALSFGSEREDLENEMIGRDMIRRGRAIDRRIEDPFLGDPFTKRIADAFRGQNRMGMLDQEQFWADFERNRIAIAQALFAGSNAVKATQQAAPILFGQRQLGPGSVTSMPADPTLGGGGMTAAPQNLDPFAPFVGPNGENTTVAVARARGWITDAPTPPMPVLSRGGAAGAAQTVVNIGGNQTILQGDLRDPKVREQVAEIARQAYLMDMNRVFAGP